MVLGTGLDLVRVDRLRAFRGRWGGGGLARIFTAQELDYCLGLADAAPSLAVRFAAKEAFFKAIRLGWGPGGAWREVEVVREASGAPSLRLSGRAAERVAEHGVRRIHLSLTHTLEVAGAVVVLEA